MNYPSTELLKKTDNYNKFLETIKITKLNINIFVSSVTLALYTFNDAASWHILAPSFFLGISFIFIFKWMQIISNIYRNVVIIQHGTEIDILDSNDEKAIKVFNNNKKDLTRNEKLLNVYNIIENIAFITGMTLFLLLFIMTEFL